MTNKAKEKEHTVELLLKDTSEIRTQTLDRVPTLYKHSSPGTRTLLLGLRVSKAPLQ